MTEMKQRSWKGKFFVLLASVAVPAVLLAGCSSEKAEAFQMAFCAPYVATEAVEAYGETVKADLPELTVEGTEPLFTAMTMGDSEADPMAAMAGMTKFSAMAAAGELDVVVSDLKNAARNARGESFLDVSSFLTEEELERYAGRLLSFDMVDDQGNPTGEKTTVCGIDVSDNETLSALAGGDECGVFVVANTSHLEESAALVRYLLENS